MPKRKPDLVGTLEMAERLDVPVQTIKTWRARGVLPAPDFELSGSLLWLWPTIAEWSKETGHPRRREATTGETS